MSFDLESDLSIEKEQAPDGSYRVHTRGLAAACSVELELLGIPLGSGTDSVGVLIAVAQALSERDAPPALDEKIAIELSASTLAVGFSPSSSGEGFLRLVDPFGEGEPESPLAAIGSIAIERALELLEPDDDAEPDALGAEAILRASVASFPGDPALRARGLPGMRFNTENHLAYAMLAQLDDDDAPRMYRSALERSAAYERGELGASLSELEAPSIEERSAMAQAIVDENLARPSLEDLSPAVTMFVSPIWEPEADGARATRRACVLPKAFEGHFATGEARALLESRGAALAVKLYAHALRAPIDALVALRPVRTLYLHEAAPSLPVERPFQPPMHLLSLLLAEVARRKRAGFDEARIAQLLDPEAAPSADDEAKLEALGRDELAWYQAAS